MELLEKWSQLERVYAMSKLLHHMDGVGSASFAQDGVTIALSHTPVENSPLELTGKEMAAEYTAK